MPVFSKWLHLRQFMRGPVTSTFLSILDIVILSNFSYPSACVVVFHCGLICIFLMINDEHFAIFLFAVIKWGAYLLFVGILWRSVYSNSLFLKNTFLFWNNFRLIGSCKNSTMSLMYTSPSFPIVTCYVACSIVSTPGNLHWYYC